MGNLVTKITTNSVELNESNVSDIVVYEKKQNQVKKDKDTKSPNTSTQGKTGLFKSVFLGGSLDPRSPSTFITRTPIQIFRNASSSKFNHRELLNESLNDTIDIDILTAEEEESLNSNKDLVDAVNKPEPNESDKDETLPDPRSPTNEILRTPIIAIDEIKKTDDNNLMKKITDKLISAKISNDNNTEGPKKTTEAANNNKKKSSKSVIDKNLIYEDEHENFDRFSTPPKKINAQNTGNDRTPLSCVANKERHIQPRALMTSTPKGSKIPILRERPSARITQN